MFELVDYSKIRESKDLGSFIKSCLIESLSCFIFLYQSYGALEGLCSS